MKKEIVRDSLIMVGGKSATVIYPSLNKVKVRFNDGTEKMVSYSLILDKHESKTT